MNIYDDDILAHIIILSFETTIWKEVINLDNDIQIKPLAKLIIKM